MPQHKNESKTRGLLSRIFGQSAKTRRHRRNQDDRSSKSHQRKKSTDSHSSSTCSSENRTPLSVTGLRKTEESEKKLKELIQALTVHVLPLLEQPPKETEGATVSKNRVLFALNHAAEKALKKKNVFGRLEQLRTEAREADSVVADFLEKDCDTRLAAMAPKCAACGAPCKKCTTPGGSGFSRPEDGELRMYSSAVSWGPDQVTDFNVSANEVNGGGFYPEPDSELLSLDENTSSSVRS
ncbi:uncharacterized protein LOC111271342 [Varroa jacobsoni]|uniref:Uncharacterized protein n=1 Tax=Varroa destructor TaxID=109461 RepID=A0A7M7K9Q5_VARDE|nr:uncharacterized protein LOC111251384 isoform X2 [Varroa destructor]XP_022707812.1 uncharacterized protein LOC111271342 [Varroa jacobsoni]